MAKKTNKPVTKADTPKTNKKRKSVEGVEAPKKISKIDSSAPTSTIDYDVKSNQSQISGEMQSPSAVETLVSLSKNTESIDNSNEIENKKNSPKKILK
jgi:hypothetical protein